MNWEHKYETIDSSPFAHNELFEEAQRGGWELVSVVMEPFGAMKDQRTFYFKRLKDSQSWAAPATVAP